MCEWPCSAAAAAAAALARECLHTNMYAFALCICVYSLCVCVSARHQVQSELSQKTENLHREVAQKQQLSEEFEQVATIISALILFFKFLSQQRVTINSQWLMAVCAYAVNLQAQRTVTELQAQLDLLKDSAEAPQADTEDVAQLKVQ